MAHGLNYCAVPDDRCVLLRREGPQPWFDILEIASELACCRTDDQAVTVLFDWTHIVAWPYSPPCVEAIRAWKERAPAIECAALVHNPKFDRHVAILSALMRADGAKVRSFRDVDEAREWLRQFPQDMVLH